MVDDTHQTEENIESSPVENVEELHVEDAAVEIAFEDAAASSPGAETAQPGDATQPVTAPGESSGLASDLVTDLERQIASLKTQLEDRTSQSMRIAADFENFRKRTSKEKEDLEAQVKGNTIIELLPVVDNFERARSQIKPQNDGEMAVHKSYQGIYKQLVESFKRLGVSPMRPEGTEFDPNFHEAVMRQPSEEYDEGIVIEQLMRGYFLGDRVLRHAMVKVAAAPEPVVTSEEDTSTEPES